MSRVFLQCWRDLLECLCGVWAQGAAEVGAAEVELARSWRLWLRRHFEGDALDFSLLECLEEGRYVELRVDGVAGEGVIELESKLLGGGNCGTCVAEGHACRGVVAEHVSEG